MGHEVNTADGGEAAWEAIQRDPSFLVISDWIMPGMDGLELCRRIRERKGEHYTYFVLLTARDNPRDRLEGLRAGADDFLAKPAEPQELAVHLQIAGRILGVQAELERQNGRLEALATTDELTGLNNRRRFFEALDCHFALASRQRLPLSLVMLDVDHFKAYNDEFGHSAGDDVLRGVAELLRDRTRGHDTAARYGGEEFVVLLPATGPIVARGMAERLRGAFERRAWPRRPITVSLGVATMTPRMRRAAELVDQADRALYHAKGGGRNRVSHATDLAGSCEDQGDPTSSIDRVPAPDVCPSGPPPAGSEDRRTVPDRALQDQDGGGIDGAYDAVVEAWSLALDLRDHETLGHSRRVTALMLKMARTLGFDEEDLPHIRRGSQLHDLGKMGIPDFILQKPGPLSEEEWRVMRQHPAFALEMLSPIAFLRPALEIPYAHHERWDGTGYPLGLDGERIPRAARAFAAVDVYDALTHDRPYRDAWSQDRALEYIDRLAGTQLDPQMVTALHRALGPV